MNILFFTRLYAPHVGGVEKHIYELSKILSKKHRITIVTDRHDDKLPQYEKTPEAEIYRIPVSGTGEFWKKWHIWVWLFEHVDLVRQADIVHAHDVYYWYLPFRFIFPQKKSFVTFHGYEGIDAPNIRKIFSHKLAEYASDGNICIGGFHQKWYHVNPTIVSFGAASSVPKSKTSQMAKAVFIGRLAGDTGIMDYLEATKNSRIPLDVYGDGPDYQKAKELIDSNKLPVRLLGFIPNASSKLPSYKIAYISRYLGILEALDAKIPVVAHYNNDIKYDYLELSPFSKYIWKVSNPQGIIQASEEILTHDKDVNRRVQAGYNWASKQTWAKLALDYQNLWQAHQ